MKIIFGLLIFLITTLYADIERPESATLERVRNLAHTFTPVTAFGFGQNIIAKKTTVFYPFFYLTAGKNSHQLQVAPVLLYGISDRLSIYGELPIIATQKEANIKSYGIGNIILQMEYALMQQTSSVATNQMTIVANVSPPTLHLHKSTSSDLLSSATIVPTIANSTSIFIGTTACHTSPDWYLYAATGVTIATQKNDTKQGNSWLYQWGIGHYLGSLGNFTCTGTLEFNGIYNQKDRACAQHLADSGGNTLFIGPSIIFCSDNWQILGGIQFPAYQKLNGVQPKQYLESILSFAVQF